MFSLLYKISISSLLWKPPKIINKKSSVSSKSRTWMELNIPTDRSIIFYLEDKNVSQRKKGAHREKDEVTNSIKFEPKVQSL